MNRRTLLAGIVAGFSALALAGFSIPFLRSLLPSFRRDFSLNVDVANMAVGEVRSVRWLGRSVLMVKRQAGRAAGAVSRFELEDPASNNSQQPEFAANDLRARRPEHLVVYANCTHLGCEVEVLAESGFAGFSCPCHRSRYDTSGRVEKDAAARRNLEVPEYDYAAQDVIRLKKV